jgi:Aldose 1-epimerase
VLGFDDVSEYVSAGGSFGALLGRTANRIGGGAFTLDLDIVCDDGPPKLFELRAGMIAIVPKGTWHRFRSAEGGTTWSATLPGDHIELDVDDPRTVERKPG